MIMETLGMRIRRRRVELGWTQETLAFEAGLRKNTIQSIEADEVNQPETLTLCKIACALQTPIYYLLPNECLEMLNNNPADLAFRELYHDLNSKEKIDSMKTIIAASSAFYLPNK